MDYKTILWIVITIITTIYPFVEAYHHTLVVLNWTIRLIKKMKRKYWR